MKQRKEELEKIIESLEKKVHEIVNEDREGQFLIDNKGKTVVLLFNENQIEGELLDIDKNRIGILNNNREVYYYKSAIKGYFKK